MFKRDPRGCDVARKATWQSHGGPRERQRGAEVTRGHYLYLIVLYRVVVHISIRYFRFKLALIFVISYILDSSS